MNNGSLLLPGVLVKVVPLPRNNIFSLWASNDVTNHDRVGRPTAGALGLVIGQCDQFLVCVFWSELAIMAWVDNTVVAPV